MPPRIKIASVLAVITLGVSACGGEQEDKDLPPAPSCLQRGSPLAIAVGLRSNSPTPRLPQSVSSLLQTASDQGSAITIIRSDGKPEVVYSGFFATNAQNGGARHAELNEYLGGLQKLLRDDVKATVPEADPLRALTLAGRSTQPGGGIVMLDSGIQTAPGLDFRDGLLTAEPDEVVEYLEKSRLLPDLKGRNVLLAGLGDTAAPQSDLDTRLHDNVVAIWKAVATAAGAACVTADPTPPQTSAPEGLPAVSTVEPPPPSTFDRCGTTDLGSKDKVGFQKGNAEFKDPAGARETLQKLASVIKEGSQKVDLTGATSSEGQEGFNQRLSERRAAKVREVLVDLGVPAGRFDTVGGVGETGTDREKDTNAAGVLLPGPAERNRKVVVRLICGTS